MAEPGRTPANSEKIIAKPAAKRFPEIVLGFPFRNRIAAIIIIRKCHARPTDALSNGALA